MNWFDFTIIHFVNSFAHRSWVADATVVKVSTNHLLIGGVFAAMIWWAWIKYGKESNENRVTLGLALAVTTFAVLAARVLALSLPFRERPCRNPLLHFQLPYTADPEILIHWSAFPSDHAVVCFCMAAGLWLVSRRLGALAICYAALINFPRIYIGAHYPTDIIAGALLGIGIMSLCKVPSFRKIASLSLDYLDRRPAYLYTLLLLWTFQIAEMFDSLRQIGVLGVKTALRYHSWYVEGAEAICLAGLLCVLAWLEWRSRRPVNQP